MDIKQVPSPHHSSRGTYKPEAIVIHIMEGTLRGTDSWFQDPRSKVSSHYGVGKNGEVHQYVQEGESAWHAGVVVRPTWKLIKAGVPRNPNPNSYTIGIEHEGYHTEEWTPEMRHASATLIAAIARRHDIPLDRDHIIGHYEIRANKPNCPAVDKGIIDELITIAKGIPADPHDEAKALLTEAAALIARAVAIINANK